ncbi:3-hydroxyacyl-[acyl-carrier-protein] dehydrataseFabZ [Buchnera aphidicola (Tetraneura ulmi)]
MYSRNENILDLLVHRHPFLFVDKILKFKKNQLLIAKKTIFSNEPFFKGHFPQRKIFPGVLILESIAQVANIFICKNKENPFVKSIYYLLSVKNARFKKFVLPGDEIIITVFFKKEIKNFFWFDGVVKVKNITVCTSTIICGKDRFS